MERETLKLRQWIGPEVIVGLLIVAIGTILLLDRIGLVDARHLLRYWPVALVLVGLLKAVQGGAWDTRIWGAILCLFGVVLLLNTVGYLHVRFWDLWPLALIGAGLVMIWGALAARRQETMPPGTSMSGLNELAVFGGGERRITAPDFDGGRLTAVCGGFKVDLARAGMKTKESTIEVMCLFGGGEMRIPENWNVLMRGTALFGGFSDSTRHPQGEAATNTLIVRGLAIFGGFEVKN